MKVRDLNQVEQTGFDSEQLWLEEYLRQFGDEFSLQRTPDDIPTLQSLLDLEPFSSGDEQALEILGAALGDVVCSALDMHWVVVDDEYGTDFAIQYRDIKVFAFPRDMIVKRVEAEEMINMTEIYNDLLAALREQICQVHNS